ncbi:aldo/keto reductase [Streptomyces radicis]|uniref:Aldo/keto reductase n=1 Tax=Streptomyces radicis TaxID=1750517 RepID=A0A3A9VRG4_9ACTN|nr:aldo/keto reductase [Streptomyces radicis]RKN03635.1 aldo/keto reductase [Streptomyces radicis]RKN13479.1 aldo/keto reductase [Streptomyces radicis]
MQYRTIPGLGREVSSVGAGCWTIGGPAINDGRPIGWGGVCERAAFKGLLRAHALGVTLYDTADVYGLGRSERLLGRLLRETHRQELVISSKVGHFSGTARHPYLPQQMESQLATTLDNLGTDHLDLYHLHSDDFGPRDTHLGPAIATMHGLRARGIVRAIGMRAPHRLAAEWANDPAHPLGRQARRFLTLFRAIRPDVITVRYNLLSPLHPAGETDIFAFARAEGVGVLMKQVLGQGLLLGTQRARQAAGFSPADHRSRKSVDPDLLNAVEAALHRLAHRFGDRRGDLARVAVHYALHDHPHAAALVGFRDASQLNATLARVDEPLDNDDIAFARAVMTPARERMNAHDTAVHRAP